MPDKKLTDSEIVKALEICGTYKGKCTDCPAFVKVDRSNCKKVLLGAVEIINRQKADLIDKEKQLQEALKSMAVNKTKVIDCEKEINRLQAENENYSKNNRQMTSDILKLYKELEMAKAEIERLKPFEDKIAEYNSHIRVEEMLVFASSLGEWLEFCDNLKAEAYKEFAEKVHTEIEQALESNYKAKGERLEKHNVGDSTDFISYCEGKIAALRGIDDFIDDRLKELVGE